MIGSEVSCCRLHSRHPYLHSAKVLFKIPKATGWQINAMQLIWYRRTFPVIVTENNSQYTKLTPEALPVWPKAQAGPYLCKLPLSYIDRGLLKLLCI